MLSKIARRFLSSVSRSPRTRRNDIFKLSLQQPRVPTEYRLTLLNPNWREIRDQLEEGHLPADRPDIVARVFPHKSDTLLEYIHRK